MDIKNKKIVTFGEIMMRLQTPNYERFIQAKNLDIVYGGGEANIAVSLATFGFDASYITKLPQNPIGDCALAEVRKYDVDTTRIIRGGERLGLYFIEKGVSQRPSSVIYDRANSSIATAKASEFDWERILAGADCFVFTGITPALSDQMAQACLDACKYAKEMGVMVAFDPNYRAKLWSLEKAGKILSQYLPYIDLFLINKEHAQALFSIRADEKFYDGEFLSVEGHRNLSDKFINQFGMKYVGISLRESISASINNWGGLLFDKNNTYKSKTYSMQIVDRVGGGDSFAAGLIYSLLAEFDMQKSIEFAVGASCLKHSIEGDFNIATLDEVLSLIESDGSGRIQR